jgi:hypothetical protein
LLIFAAVVQEGYAEFDHSGKDLVNGSPSQRRVVVQVTDELAAQGPDVIDVSLDRFRRQVRRSQVFQEGTANNCSPGGRSFSRPIHERGQPFKSRQ